jgi:hypothetical protein
MKMLFISLISSECFDGFSPVEWKLSYTLLYFSNTILDIISLQKGRCDIVTDQFADQMIYCLKYLHSLKGLTEINTLKLNVQIGSVT